MDTWIFEYTNFLLASHNCVIIAGLGGFIRNGDVAYYSDQGQLCPPRETVIFNQDLKHDDGLLVSFCQKNDNLSYEQASKRIKGSVEKIRIKLDNKEHINCSNLGCLYLSNDRNIIFEPNFNYIHPNTWVLPEVKLSILNKISLENHSIAKPLIHKRKGISVYIAAAIILIIFLLTPPIDTTINHNENSIRLQQANIFPILKNEELFENKETNVNFQKNTLKNISDVKINKILAEKNYYIILGSGTSKDGIKLLLKKFKKDFSDVRILESKDRYRIYIKTFEDKRNAELYLQSFRLKNLKYKDAWLLSVRNK